MYGLFTRIKSFHSKNSYDTHKKQVFRPLFKYLKTLKETSPRTNAPEPVQIPVLESVYQNKSHHWKSYQTKAKLIKSSEFHDFCMTLFIFACIFALNY